MAISNYDELKTAMADWSHRTDLTAKMGDFITLAESRINRTLNFNQQELETSLTATIGSRFIALPSGFIAPIDLWLTYYLPRERLRFLPPEQMPIQVSAGEPDFWTIDGSNIALDSEADKLFTFDFRYTSLLTLSDVSPTNWLLTNHPDVYLQAGLMELAAFIRDNELLGLAKGAFDLALMEVNEKEHRSKALSTLTTELGGRTTTNIFEG